MNSYLNQTGPINQVEILEKLWSINCYPLLPLILDTKIELKEYEHTISYLQKGEDIEKGVKNAGDRYSLIGVKLGRNYLLKKYPKIMSKYSELKSKWEKYIYIWYIPTIMITISSWFFYLLPSTSYPARLEGWKISQFQFLISCQGLLFS